MRTRQGCEDGDAGAMCSLGFMYRDSLHGLARDEAQAFKWFGHAADLGEPSALTSFGYMYCQGKGVEANLSRGAVCLGRAAALGSEHACYLLGLYHKDGSCGFDKDVAAASYWSRQMATCPLRNSTEQSREKAAEWLRNYPVRLSS